jgi:hypothetical protein
MLLTGLRVEWCKARARAMRWGEEVELLQEEVRRVLCFMRWHADWWHKKKTIFYDDEGLNTYAGRQAQLREDLTACFKKMWEAHFPTIIHRTTSTTFTPATMTHADLPDLDIPALSPYG